MLIEDDYDARARLAIEQLKEHAIFDRIPQTECDVICETIEFLRLHAGALDVHLREMCDWRSGNRPVTQHSPTPEGQGKCGWRPIEEAPKFGDLPVLVWDRGDLIEVLWEREHKTDALSWCRFETDRFGTDVWKMKPQPKYYLAVVPPPEG